MVPTPAIEVGNVITVITTSPRMVYTPGYLIEKNQSALAEKNSSIVQINFVLAFEMQITVKVEYKVYSPMVCFKLYKWKLYFYQLTAEVWNLLPTTK